MQNVKKFLKVFGSLFVVAIIFILLPWVLNHNNKGDMALIHSAHADGVSITPVLINHGISASVATVNMVSSSTMTWTPSIGDTLVVAMCAGTINGDAPSISDSQGNSWNMAVNTATNVASSSQCRLAWSKITKASSPLTLMMTFTAGNLNSTKFVISEWSGLASTSVEDVENVNIGTATSLNTGALNTANASDLVIGVFMDHGSNSTYTAGSGFTALDNDGGALGIFDEYQVVSSTGDWHPTATESKASGWAAAGVALKAATTTASSPTIYSVSTSSITSSSAVISWTTDQPATSQVYYGLTSSYTSNTTKDTNLVTSHSVTISGLSPNTTYHYQASSVNSSSQSTTSPDGTFTTSVVSYTISTSTTSGSGTITCSGTACPSSVSSGTSETFTETPSSGYTFSGWGGACSGTSSTCTLTINANTSVSASFTSTQTSGNYVYVTPVLINHGISTSVATVGNTSSSTMTWTPTIGNTLVVAMCAGNSNGDVPTISDSQGNSWNMAVNTATNAASSSQCRLAWSKITKASSPLILMMTFVDNLNSTKFVISEWSGLASTSVEDVESVNIGTATSQDTGALNTTNASDLVLGVFMDYMANSSYTHGSGFTALDNDGGSMGIFEEYQNVSSTGDWRPTATESKASGWAAAGVALKSATTSAYTISTSTTSGSGTITCSGTACPSSVSSGTSETFTETPSSGYTFSGWGGACSGTSSTCTLTINANTSVSASFTSTQTSGNYVYVTSAGSGTDNGTDWNNACAGFTGSCSPSSMVRGDTYYVAGGSYAWSNFNTPDNGHLITIKGATVSNHGTDTGWSSSLSVDSTEGGQQARTTTTFSISTNNWTFDGSVGTASSSDYGFGMHINGVGPTNLVTLTAGMTGLTITHFEVDGINCCSISDNTEGATGFYIQNGANIGSALFDHLYMHDMNAAPFLFGGTVTVQHSYFARTRYTGSMHSEVFSYRGGNGFIFRYNIVEDVAGTGEVVALDNLATDMEVYGNVFRGTPACSSGGCSGSEHPVISNCLDGNSSYNGIINGLKFYNNTIYSLHGNAGVNDAEGCSQSSNFDVRNNLWVDNAAGASTKDSFTYNTFWNTYLYNSNTGIPATNRWICGSNSNCSTNAPGANQGTAPTASQIFSSAPYNLHLNSNTIGGYSMAGTALSAPYNVDMDGNVRSTWTIGAYEYTSNGSGSPTTYNISISTAGTGQGSVTCGGSACPSSANSGDTVTLTANPSSGSTFSGWSGSCTNSTGTCTVSSDASVTANFSDTQNPTVSITSPLANATVSGASVSLAATASDNIRVASVQFKLDGTTNIGSAITTPSSGSTYSSSWNTTVVSNGSHVLSAYAVDGAGNSTLSNTVTVTVSNSVLTADVTVPSVPTGLSASALSSSQIEISWNVSTDPTISGQVTSGLAGYQIYRNGTQIGTSTTNWYLDSGLSSSTSYSYAVTAYDSASPANISSRSSSVSTSTLALSQTSSNLPVISQGSPSGSLTSGTTQTILSVVTGEAAICRYSTVANTPYASMSNTFSTTTGTNHSTSVSGLANGTSYNYYVRCQDSQSQSTSTSDYAVSFSVASAAVVTGGGSSSNGGNAGTTGGGGGGGGGSAVATVVSTVATTSTATSTTGASATIKPLISTSLLALAPYSRGDQVLALQNSLIKYGYLASGLNTGYLGPLTQAAIAKYKAVLASVSSGISSANAPATGTTTASVSYFTRKLKVGSIGSDVRALQVFLNAHGFRVASSGNGSVGHESTYYGTATAAAVSRFQIAHASDILAPYGLTAGTGNFGAATMKVVNGME